MYEENKFLFENISKALSNVYELHTLNSKPSSDKPGWYIVGSVGNVIGGPFTKEDATERKSKFRNPDTFKVLYWDGKKWDTTQ